MNILPSIFALNPQYEYSKKKTKKDIYIQKKCNFNCNIQFGIPINFFASTNREQTDYESARMVFISNLFACSRAKDDFISGRVSLPFSLFFSLFICVSIFLRFPVSKFDSAEFFFYILKILWFSFSFTFMQTPISFRAARRKTKEYVILSFAKLSSVHREHANKCSHWGKNLILSNHRSINPALLAINQRRGA